MIEQTSGVPPATDFVDALRSAITTSVDEVALESVEDVEAQFGRPASGPLSKVLYQRLQTILTVTDRTGFDTHHLRAVAGAFHLQVALREESVGYADVLAVIASGLQAGTELKDPTDAVWVEAATLGRALIVLDVYRSPDPRHISVAAAAKRLKEDGFDLILSGPGIDPASPGLEAATKAISERFERLGLFDVLRALCGAVRRVEVYDSDQYPFGRHYGFGEREPRIPFGFLFNLAVKAPDLPSTSANPDVDWREAIELARDLAAIIDVEP